MQQHAESSRSPVQSLARITDGASIERLIIMGALLLAIPLSALTAGNSVLDPDVMVTNGVQDLRWPGVTFIVAIMNWLGSGGPLVFVGMFIAYILAGFRRFGDAAFVLLAVATSQIANAVLKHLFVSPRPPDEFVTASQQSGGFGFPSGHTMSALVVVGCLAYVLMRTSNRRCVRLSVPVMSGLIVLSMGFSRIYVGAHWPSDVLGAYLWGALFTVGMVTVYRRWQELSVVPPHTPRRIRISFCRDDDEYRAQCVDRLDPVLGLVALVPDSKAANRYRR
jgi:undecaprenyl-diphosphatase